MPQADDARLAEGPQAVAWSALPFQPAYRDQAQNDRRLVKKYGEMAGIPEKFCHAHIFKHSCATHLFDKGFHVEQVQDWLGHVNR